MERMSNSAIGKAVALIALGIGVDQWTKIWASNDLRPLGSGGIPVVPSTLSLVYVENRAAAFGLGGFLPEAARKWVLLALTLALTVGLFVAMIRSPDLASRIGFGVTISGAIGNILDRARLGYVVDFIYWYRWFQWPNFNVADMLVCTGIGVLVVFGGRGTKNKDELPEAPATAAETPR